MGEVEVSPIKKSFMLLLCFFFFFLKLSSLSNQLSTMKHLTFRLPSIPYSIMHKYTNM